MSIEIVIRRPEPSENDSVHAPVQVIADETFASLFAPSQVPIGEADWLSAWVGTSGEEIVGVTMTPDEWVSDLWCDAMVAGLASAGSCWRTPNVKYVAVGITRFAFGWSSRILGPWTFIRAMVGEFTVSVHMRSLVIRCSN
jgi:hypothetical protein